MAEFSREDLDTVCEVHPYKEIPMPPNGTLVKIDVDMIPFVTALWGHGYETLLSCQNLGEAVIRGGTLLQGQAEREELSARTGHLTWLIVRTGQEQLLMHELQTLVDAAGGWHTNPSDVPGWTSVCIPIAQVQEATALLSS